MINREKEVEMPFNTTQFFEKWQEWLQYRKERRLPKYVPTGLKRTFTKLFNDSGGVEQVAIQMIDYSMSQNYQGIFKQNGNGKNGKPGFIDNARKFML